MRLFPENLNGENKINKALFLDRDGVINQDLGYVYKAKEFYFIDGIFEFIKFALMRKFIIIVITNQAGIGRGLYTMDDFKKISYWMLEIFSSNGCQIHGIYFSPFHPIHGKGFYKKKENSRKPAPGMLTMARDDFNINMDESIIIGDKYTDIEAGFNSGVKEKILLRSNDESINQNISFKYHKAKDFNDVQNLIKSF